MAVKRGAGGCLKMQKLSCKGQACRYPPQQLLVVMMTEADAGELPSVRIPSTTSPRLELFRSLFAGDPMHRCRALSENSKTCPVGLCFQDDSPHAQFQAAPGDRPTGSSRWIPAVSMQNWNFHGLDWTGLQECIPVARQAFRFQFDNQQRTTRGPPQPETHGSVDGPRLQRRLNSDSVRARDPETCLTLTVALRCLRLRSAA